VKQDERAPFVRALHRARLSAYAPGEFVEQEGFMRAGEIRALASQAGIAPGVSVLDLCCGVAGPGRFITQELGCTYLGVDFSSSALDIARDRAGDLPCRFEVWRIPPLPPGPFDVVLLFETMLAFPEKEPLLEEISRALATGGRFVFTMEEGQPLTEAERERMPDADTVWLTPLPEMLTCLERVGLVVHLQDDCSRSHRAVADSLISAFAADATAIAAQIGRPALEELLAAHRLWSQWLREGRVRKIAFVAEKAHGPRRGRAAMPAVRRLQVSAPTAKAGMAIDYPSSKAAGSEVIDGGKSTTALCLPRTWSCIRTSMMSTDTSSLPTASRQTQASRHLLG
jgi:SAM-dependent methyltransferase